MTEDYWQGRYARLEHFLATAAQINALPEVAALTLTRDQNAQLVAALVAAGKLLVAAEELLRFDWCAVYASGEHDEGCGGCEGERYRERRKEWLAEYGRWERARARGGDHG